MDTKRPDELQFDRNNLYVEEVFTDMQSGSIRRLTPVLPDGTRDMSRPQVFTGQAQLLSPAGPLPIQCNIDAGNLDEAMTKFPEAINAAVEDLVREAEDYRRQEASRIVIPGRENAGNIKL